MAKSSGNFNPEEVSRQQDEYLILLETLLDYSFTTKKGVACAKEALTHSTATTLAEGNLRLARLGESVMKTNGLERLYLAGQANGMNVSSLEQKYTINNLSTISKSLDLQSLIITSGSKPSISDRMAAQVLQAVLAAVYVDGRMESLTPILLKNDL